MRILNITLFSFMAWRVLPRTAFSFLGVALVSLAGKSTSLYSPALRRIHADFLRVGPSVPADVQLAIPANLAARTLYGGRPCASAGFLDAEFRRVARGPPTLS